MRQLTEGSLFAGIMGFALGAKQAGIKSLWASEIEPFPMEVAQRRFPEATQLGDVTKVDGRTIAPVDILTFGSPCQDLLVANTKRAGLEGSRSSLFNEAIRIIREMREVTNGRYPRIAVWENVPGALSSNRGEDFRAVIEAFVQTLKPEAVVSIPRSGRWTGSGVVVGDGWSLAWRILDAQHFGVPQRRRRIFVVCDFAGERAEEILLERKGLCGNSATRREAREGAAGGVEDGSVGGFREQLYDMTHAEEVIRTVEIGLAPTLNNRMGTGGNQVPIMLDEVPLAVDCRNMRETPMSGTLQAKESGSYSLSYINPVRIKYRVRRLTPVECERLQGFPDDWTAPGADSKRYRALGNAVAVPVVAWIMRRIAAYVASNEKSPQVA